MFLATLKDIIKGKYKLIQNDVVIEEGQNFKVDGLTGWFEVKSIEACEDYTVITVK